MIRKKNITLVIGSLAGGGAEKILLILAEGLKNRGHKVTILTLDNYVPDFYKIPKGIKRIFPSKEYFLSCRWFNIKCQIKREKALKKTILSTSPDVIISFLEIPNIKTIAALSTTKIPTLVAEHSDPRYLKISKLWDRLRLLWYPLAANVVVLTDEVKEKWADKKWPKWNTVVVPNPVIKPRVNKNSAKPNWFGEKNLIAMGRLVELKGFDKLISVFSTLANKFPDWNLTILGEGYLRPKLEELIKRYQLIDRVFLPGAINPPYDILAKADLFVMTSDVEGFPNALCEAMACGLPVVSFDCPSGPRAIIRNNIDGVLVPPNDTEALAKVLADLMGNDERRMKLAERAPEILERFSFKKYLDSWDEIILKALKDNKKFKIWGIIARTGGFIYKFILRKFY